MNHSLTITRLIDEIPVFSADVITLLPADWQHQLASCSDSHSRWQVLGGGSATSREREFADDASPTVAVVTGDIIATELPWLDALYRNDFLSMGNSLGLGDFDVCSDLRAATNINTTPRGSRYEWHVDSNPLTGLLFGTTLTPEDGGQLIFRPDPISRPNENWTRKISPVAGTLLLFDAREAAHVVTSLNADLRLSVPMNYYFRGQQARPDDLNDYLYA